MTSILANHRRQKVSMSRKSAIVVSEPKGVVRRQILLRVIWCRGGNVLDLRDCYKVSLADLV